MRAPLLGCAGKDIHAISIDVPERFEAQARSTCLMKLSVPQPQGLVARILRPQT